MASDGEYCFHCGNPHATNYVQNPYTGLWEYVCDDCEHVWGSVWYRISNRQQ